MQESRAAGLRMSYILPATEQTTLAIRIQKRLLLRNKLLDAPHNASVPMTEEGFMKREELEVRVQRLLAYILEMAEGLRSYSFEKIDREKISSEIIRARVSASIDTSICSVIRTFLLKIFRERDEDFFAMSGIGGEIDDHLLDEIPRLPIIGLLLLEKLEGRDIFKVAIREALYEIFSEFQQARMLEVMIFPRWDTAYWFQEGRVDWLSGY